jgi:hypothetical protein
VSYAYCTAGIAACSASRPRAKQAPEDRDRLSPARSASPRRKVARPIAYVSEMGDGMTGAKVAGEMNMRSVIAVPPHSWW